MLIHQCRCRIQERGLKLFFQDYSRGLCSSRSIYYQAFFISADSRTHSPPLENLFLSAYGGFFSKRNQVQGGIFCFLGLSEKKSKGGWCSGLKRERKISLYVAKSGLLSSSSASSMLPFNGLSCVLPYSLIYIHRSGKRLNNNSPFQTYKKENGNVTKKP